MRQVKNWFAFAALAMVLAGCQTLGNPVAQADSFSKKIILANSTIEATATNITTLVSSGKLSKDEAQDAINALDNASSAVDLARKTYNQNPKDAESRLSLTLAALTTLQAELARRQQ
jgi:hypothetical protein